MSAPPRPASKTPLPTAPLGLPNKIWFVIWPNGERNFLHREPLEGIAAWAKGVNATIVEYTFKAVVHTPPPAEKKSPK